MAWQSTPWADPLLAATVVSGSLAVFGLLYVLSIRRDRRVVAFATVMVAAAVWTLGYSFQFASATLPEKLQWALVSMMGEAVVPTAWFTFAAAYAGYDEWLRPRVLAALWVVPVMTVLLAATNSVHGLVWAGAALGEAPDGAYLVLERAGGPWLLVHGAYSYFVAAAGVVVIIGLIERSRHVYRGQALVLFGGGFVAAAAHMASLAEAGPAAAVDLTGPSLSVLGIAFAIGIFRYRMFDLVPVARASIIENMGEGYVLLDRGGEVVDVNAAARSLLGGEDGRLIGRPAREVFEVDLAVLNEFDNEATAATVAIDDEPTASTAAMEDGTATSGDVGRRYLELTVSAIEADGVAGRFLWVRDVTDRIRLERRFQTLIERSSDVVFRLDEDGIVRYASPSIRRVLGYEPADLEDDLAFEELLVDDRGEGDREEREDGDRTALDRHATATETWKRLVGGDADSDTVRFEVQLRTAAGEVRFIEAVARYLVDDPAVGGIVINARDVTERTEQELELLRTNERLDQFASLVGHDLRNPLNVATGHLEMAMETGDTDSLETVREQHQRMEAMIEDLLSLAREGRTVEDPSPVALAAAARQAWSTVDTRGASLAVDADAEVLADESRLYNLFENLFRNAVEHGPGGGENGIEPADLTVRVEAVPGGFAVGDDGVGIPAGKREQVLESGYTTRSGNTGFGLAIVEEVAAAHGWGVSVTENADGGARFEFTGVDRPTATAPDAANGEVD